MKVIDTLSEGFGAANRRLWIVAIPVLVDLFLWLGPKATIGSDLAQKVQLGLPAQYGSYGALIQQTVAGLNLFSVAILYLPSLVVRLDSLPLDGLVAGLNVNTSASFLLVALGTLLAGLWLGCLYLGFIAQVVRDGDTSLLRMARSVWRYWGRLITLLLLVAATLLVAAIPLGLIFIVLSAFSTTAGELAGFVIQIAAIWAIVYLSFAVEALLLSEVGPLKAIRLSVLVIAGNFWAAITLIGISFLLTLGLPLAWQFMAGTPAGLAAAIIGNAYVGTGVAAAGFVFYKERVERLSALQAANTLKEAR